MSETRHIYLFIYAAKNPHMYPCIHIGIHCSNPISNLTCTHCNKPRNRNLFLYYCPPPFPCNFDVVPPSPPWYQNFPVPSFNNKCFYWECYFALAIVPSPQVFHLCSEHCSLHICRPSGQTCVRNDRGSNNFQFRNSFSTLITSLVTPSCSLRRTWIHSWRWRFSVNALYKKKSWSTSPVSVYKMKEKRMEWKCPHVEKWKHGQQMAISLPRAIAKQICNS